MYTAVVLTPESQSRLIAKGMNLFPETGGWEIIAHHMTINMGSADDGPAIELLGKTVDLEVVSMASNDKVCAVGVKSDCPSNNEIPHITFAVNRRNGGKPYLSNLLEKWEDIEPFQLTGVVQECR